MTFIHHANMLRNMAHKQILKRHIFSRMEFHVFKIKYSSKDSLFLNLRSCLCFRNIINIELHLSLVLVYYQWCWKLSSHPSSESSSPIAFVAPAAWSSWETKRKFHFCADCGGKVSRIIVRLKNIYFIIIIKEC